MIRMILRVVVACVPLLLAACSDTTGPQITGFTIGGTVIDETGAPVSDAAVLLDFDFVTEVPVTADKPRASIAFDLPGPARFTLTITDVCDDEVYFAVSDSAVEPGARSVVWDGKDLEGRALAEGFFHYHLEVEGRPPRVGDLALARNLGAADGDFGAVESATVRDAWRVSAWTDADGRFLVDRTCWEFGATTTAFYEQGNETGTLVVAPRLRVWVYGADRPRGRASAWVDVDPATGADIPVRFGERVGKRRSP